MALEFEVSISSGEVLKGWHFPADQAKRNLCIITGMDEYAMRYAPFAEWMNAHGVHVWVLDAFGQGRNAASIEELERWPKDAFQKQVEAIHEMIVLARKNGLPTAQMGHSMGSFLTQARLQRYPLDADATILMGSNGGQAALMKAGHVLAKAAVNRKNWDVPNETLTTIAFASYAKSVPNAKSPADWLSYNEENVRTYLEDPWCGAVNTGGFWVEFLKGLSTLWDKKNMARVSPDERILLVAGTEDPVGQMSKGVRWLYNAYRRLGVTDVVLKLYPLMRHEILKEDGKEKVCEDILAFIEKEV